ncbi:galactosyldiacylglycerol synthase [Candidatus Chloroploca sp. M-50]|uniref:Galactosyldiacylglycerol synthase n=1 Tax=Candidatus Chloroploca mongolica TaxID=2528176 RepID=A0ABS4DHD7_9CHLR|nr:UDP-N-acetylglucosamine--LPS N-acetylglucosamine transferase [Candidatus Chloroploca mongolica]MBP1468845.1 galactosyldiacylglycerol synthase [Candidatus Chloroploca mongolica]
MRRILILHALLGTGHLSAARALDAAFARFPGVEAHVEDSLDFINPALSSLWKKGYKELSEHAAGLYSQVYRAADTDDAQRAMAENLRGATRGWPFFQKLEHYVAELAPAAIIAVMPVPLALMSQLKTEGRLACPLYGVVTDFLAHSVWAVPHVTRYFVPSRTTAAMLAWQGLDPATLTVTGIPINPAIAEPKQADKLRWQHKLPLDRPLVTIFGGGVDPATIAFIAARLVEQEVPLTLVICAGRNERLLDALAGIEGNATVGLQKLGMIDYVDDLVTTSDLVISKPGGLITSEVLARGTPMITICPLPGQEEPNADFVTLSGAGISLRVPELVPITALHLLESPALLSRMRANAQAVGKPRAALTIAEQVLDDLDVI